MLRGSTPLLRPLFDLTFSLLLSRILSGGALVLFAALAGPEPFAPFGIYLALVTILWVVVCGRYEQAIVFASDTQESLALAWLAAGIGAIVVTFGIGVAIVWVVWGLPLPIALAGNTAVLTAVPASLTVRAASSIALNWATREGEFKTLGRANWVQALVQAGLQLWLLKGGFEPVVCLVMADIAGFLGAVIAIAAMMPSARSALIHRPAIVDIRASAARWRMMPIWNLPTSLLSVAALSAPALVIALHYPSAIAGQLVLGIRLLEVPTNVFTSAATPILQKHLSASTEKSTFILRALGLLGAVSLISIALAEVFSMATANLWDETRWSVAIAAVPWLAPYFAGLAVSGPVVALVGGLRAEREAAWRHAVFLGLTMVVVALAETGISWQVLMAAFGGTMLFRVALFSRLLTQRAAAMASAPT
jgi:O-antigen/teichoic acid export membrane protein